MKDQLNFDTTEIADSDSVGAYLRSSDGTLVTHTTDGSREAIDVYTELGQAEDSAHVSGDTGVMGLAVRSDAGGTLASTDGDYTPLQVDAAGALRVNAVVNVDANSDYAEDSTHTSGDTGGFILGIRMDDVDGSNSALLAGTEGDYQGIFTNAKGEMHVRDNDAVDILTTIDADTSAIALDTAAMVIDLAAIEVEQLAQGITLDSILVDTGTIASDTTSIDATLTALSKAEDAAHASGDQGVMGLAVRNDTLASLADTDGDYTPLQVDADGALYTYLTGSDPLTVNDAALANTAIASNVNTLGTANVAEDIVASPLAARKYLWIYNNDNKKLFIGATGVTATNGFPISPGSYMEMRAGASVDIEWVSSKLAHNIRTLEMS